jgi:putative PIN family toxin of toxin-antitoxin system
VPGKRPLLVVADTNVLVSALLGKRLRLLFEKLKECKFELVFSEETLAELITILKRPKFERYLTPDDINEFSKLLSFHSRLVVPTDRIKDCRDPKDNIFLECAITEPVDFIITGDHDLLSLNPFHNIPIITPHAFFNR